MTDPETRQTDPAAKGVVEERIIPLVEERVTVGVRAIEGRTVSVTTRPVTENVEVKQPLTSETIDIERIAMDRVVDSIPEARVEGDTTIIPVVEERVTVTVELVLKEEIHLHRSRTEDVYEQTVPITTTEVDITG